MRRKYAQGTSVSVERSQTEINRVLGKFGADQFINASNDDPPAVMIGFRAHKKLVRFHLPMPHPNDYTGTDLQVEKKWQQECRRRWRALVLVLKAKLEAVESGITTFEEEFYSHIMMPGGKTIFEMTHEGVEKALATGKNPAFGGLLGFSGDATKAKSE